MKQNEHEQREILVVDDEPDNLGVISGYLQDAGYQCSIASNGNTAIERAARIKPGVILLDVKMPGMDGFEVCRRLKHIESTREIPVIFLTVLDDSESKRLGFGAGGVDYIAKPVQKEELLARVGTHLENYLYKNKLQQEIFERKRAAEALAKTLINLQQAEENLQVQNEELQVQNRELHAQNEEFLEIQDQLEESRQKYLSLYNLAPIGYCTFDKAGTILEANLTVTCQLGVERVSFIKKNFYHYIVLGDRDNFYHHLRQLFETKTRQICEIRLIKKDGSRFYAQLESVVIQKDKEHFSQCQTAISDITERKPAENELRKHWEHLEYLIEERTIDLRKEIAERKQAEGALRESEEKFRSFFELSADLVCIADINGYFRLMNSSFQKVLGYPTDELLGKPFLDFIHPDDKDKTLNIITEKLEKGETVLSFENRYICKDGGVAWLEWTSQPIIDKGLAFAIARDVTARKQMEKELRKNQHKLVEVQRVAKIGNWEWDLPTNTVIWSKELYLIFGLDEGTYTPTPEGFPELIHPDDVSSVLSPETFKQNNHAGAFEMEYRIIDQTTKHTKYVHVWGEVINDSEGNPIKNVGTFQDITERKQAEEALRETKESLAMAQEVADIGSWDWNIATDTLTWSDKTYRQFGLEPGELKASYSAFEKCVHPDDLKCVNAAVQQALKGEKPYSIDARMMNADGTEWMIHAQGIVYRDHDGTPIRFIGTQQNITERKQAEEKIRQQNEFLNNIIESLTHPFYVIDAYNYNIVLANLHARALGGADAKTCYALTHEQSSPCQDIDHPCPLQELKRTKKPVTAEQIHYDQDGNPRHVEIRGFPILDETGDLVQMIEYTLDITKRNQAEEELRLFKAIAEFSQEAIAISDPEGRLVYINPAHEKLFGRSLKEARQLNYRDYYPPESLETLNQIVAPAVSRGESWEGILDVFDANGRRFPLWERTGTVFDAEGKLLYGFGFMHDDTERIQAEEHIKKQARLLDLIFEHSLDSIVLLDKEYNFIRVSETYAKACQRDASEFPGHNHFEWYPSDFKAEADEAKKRKYIYRKSARPFIFPDQPDRGTTYWNLGLVPILDQEGEIELFLFTLKDVTEQVRAEEQINASLKEKEVLLQEIHHRVKNNLQVISSLLDLSRLRTRDQQTIDLLTDACARIHSMAMIHTQLYHSEQFEQIDMGSHIRKLVSYLSTVYAERKRITPRVEASGVCLALIQAVPCALILNELIANAFKHAFTEGQAGTLEISMQQSPENTIVLNVKDNGIGIRDDIDLEHTNTLGLKLVRILVQQLRGELQVIRDMGTAFMITFDI